MEIAIKALQLILALSLLVFVHELGHYLAARMFGIRVDKFYLFFDAWGFSLFKFKIGETTFGLGWLPFGGYCKIAGMIDESMDTEQMKQPPQPWEFRTKPAWQRLIVMVAGVVMNVVAAIVIYICMSWHWGDSYLDNRDVKWGYAFNDLAREIGFRNGDRVVSVDGAAVEGDYSDIFRTILLNDRTVVRVERDGAQLDVEVPESSKADILNLDPEEDGSFIGPRAPFVIDEVEKGSTAATAGIMPGDSLVALNGVAISFVDQMRPALAEAAGTVAEMTFARGGGDGPTLLVLNVPVSESGQLGVVIKIPIAMLSGGRSYSDFLHISTREYSFTEAVPAGLRRAWQEISDYWKQLRMIGKPKTGAYKKTGSFFTIGSIFPDFWDWFSFWRITAFISIALAVVNILPIPALDGGHTLFLLWEVVTRRRPSDKFLEWAQMVGLVLVVLLLVLTMGNDIYRFFIKGS